jgi:hypothetical protein
LAGAQGFERGLFVRIDQKCQSSSLGLQGKLLMQIK